MPRRLDTIYVAFRKRIGGFVDDGIAHFEHGDLVHAELVLGPASAFAAHAWTGLGFYVPVYDANWVLVAVKCRADFALVCCRAMDRNGYDYLDAALFAMPRYIREFCRTILHKIIPVWGRQFCSMAVAKILTISEGPQFSADDTIDPVELFTDLRAHCGDSALSGDWYERNKTTLWRLYEQRDKNSCDEPSCPHS